MDGRPGRRGGQDMLSGAMFAVVGAGALWLGRNYPMGTAVRLGSGVFPMLLGWGLVGVGGIVFARGAVAGGAGLTGWAWWPVLMVTLAAVSFALLIEPAGLIATMLVLMTLGAVASETAVGGPVKAMVFAVVAPLIAANAWRGASTPLTLLVLFATLALIPAAMAARVRELAVFFAAMIALALAIFIWGLGMPIRIFPWS